MTEHADRRLEAEAERALIGSCLLDGAAITRVTPIVGAEHLVEHRHRIIFSACAELADRGEPCDAVLVAGELERAGKLADAGGREYLVQLAEESVSSANIEAYARRVRAASDRRIPRRSEPEPLRRPSPPPADYPIDALGDILAPAARRLRDVVQAPAALCGQSLLAGASLAAQAHADVVIDGRREPLSLSLISIALSGERKSSTDELATAPHAAFERRALDDYKGKKALFDVELAAYEAAARAANKGKDPEAIKAAMLKLGRPPEPPPKPLLLVGAPTLEGLHRVYKFGLPSVGLFHDDAGEFLGGHAMNQENRTKSAAGLSKLYDRGTFDRIRAADGAEKFFGRRLTMHLMMQPVVAERVLSDDVLVGQGFLARCLLAWPTSTIGSRPYVDADISADPAMTKYSAVITSLLERELPLRSGSTNELDPRPISLSSAAKRVWIAVHDAIETDMRDGGAWASVRPWAAKAPAQVLRIAGVLALLARPDCARIEPDDVERGAALVNFALGEAVRVVGTASVPADVRHAEALLAWCHAEKIRRLHSRAALQYGPSAIRTKRVFDAAMLVLERAGWAVPIDGGAVIDGARRRRAWAIQEAT